MPNETSSPHIWKATCSSEVIALSGMFCFSLRLNIPLNSRGVIIEIEKQSDNPDPALTIEWTLDGEKVTLKHPRPYGLVGLILKADTQAVT